MLSTPITEQVRQREWNAICTIAKNNVFPSQMRHNLRNKIIRIQETKKKFPYKHRKRNGSHSHIIVHLYIKLPTYSKTPI